jgi:hypothetical protein
MLYYESHVTVEPVFDEKLCELQNICSTLGFKVADLFMKKRQNDTAERSQYDTFCTGRSHNVEDLKEKMFLLVSSLRGHAFKVWRYKIEAVIIDSRVEGEIDG